jgi:tRNA(fMet)-specific endonuclease VapC
VKILLDTNRYIDFCKGDDRMVQIIRKAEEIYIPFIVIAELRAGFACGSRGPENEKILVKFLNKRRVNILFADEDTTRHYAYLFRQLKTQGTPIPTNDLWIASLAIQNDLHLCSGDRHFKSLAQIPVI